MQRATSSTNDFLKPFWAPLGPLDSRQPNLNGANKTERYCATWISESPTTPQASDRLPDANRFKLPKPGGSLETDSLNDSSFWLGLLLPRAFLLLLFFFFFFFDVESSEAGSGF